MFISKSMNNLEVEVLKHGYPFFVLPVHIKHCSKPFKRLVICFQQEEILMEELLEMHDPIN